MTAENAGSESEISASIDKFSMASHNFGLTINFKKIKVMHQPFPSAQYTKHIITGKR